MKFSVEDFFIKCDQIRSFLRIWSHLLKKNFMKHFIFRQVLEVRGGSKLRTSFIAEPFEMRTFKPFKST